MTSNKYSAFCDMCEKTFPATEKGNYISGLLWFCDSCDAKNRESMKKRTEEHDRYLEERKNFMVLLCRVCEENMITYPNAELWDWYLNEDFDVCQECLNQK